MPVNIKSLQGRLLNIAKEKKIEFQILLNRLAAEQFLYRLSLSPHADKFIFKGGSLLTYLIDSERKTKDLDFSIREISNQVDEMVKMIRSILDIPMDDGLEWREIEGQPLNHPEMEQAGVRITCRFLFGKMKGVVRMDLAIGDIVDPVKLPLERLKYRGEPFFSEIFSVLSYLPETVFAEKLQIVLKKRGQNTRMKDYYDLFKLMEHDLDRERLKKCIQDVLTKRQIPLTQQIEFEDEELARLQIYWEHFLKREKMTGTPGRIGEIVVKMNTYLKKLYGG